MYWTKRHVLVCTSQHCQQKGAMDVVGLLRLQIVRQKLDAEILVNNCGTIDLCDIGPNLVIYPDNVIYRGVSKRDLPEIIERLKGGPEVERLVLNADTPDEVARRDFFADVLTEGVTVSAATFGHKAEASGFSEDWVREQQRRGFIARKPDDQGNETITVTKKTRDRYRLNG